MMEGFIKTQIQKFFEQNYSKNTQLKFRQWFLLNKNHAEADEAMQALWDESPSVVTNNTWEDLAKMQKRIADEQPQFNRIHLPFRQIAKYAAVIMLVVISSVTTYYITKSSSLEFAEFSVPYGECQKMQLADGTSVWLNAGSTLIYPKKFSTDTRTVYLCGEANFSVVKNPKKPFIVKTKHIDVQALGTKFNVQSYPDMTFTTATLVEGSVRVNTDSKTVSGYILKPNDQLIYSNQNHNVSIVQVDAAKVSSWEKGYLIFQGATFEDIVSTLERKYNVRINYDIDKYKGRTYFLKFNPSESVKQVVSVLCQLANRANYKINNSTIYIYSSRL